MSEVNRKEILILYFFKIGGNKKINRALRTTDKYTR